MKQVAGMAFAGAWWYKVTDIKACGTMNWPEPIVIVSDLHLNRHQDWKDRFRGLSGVWKDAGTVVFNGDLVDWDPWGREGYVKEIRSFAERECRLRGIVPVAVVTTALLTVACAWRASVSWMAVVDGQSEKFFVALLLTLILAASAVMLPRLLKDGKTGDAGRPGEPSS